MNPPTKQRSLGHRILTLPIVISLKVIASLMIAIILSIIVEWIGLTFIWKDNPDHAKKMLYYEYDLARNSFETAIFGIYPYEIINKALYHCSLLAQKIGIMNYLAEMPYQMGFVQSFIQKFSDYFAAAGYIFLLIIMRTIIFLLSLPWYIICGFVALVDGIVERSIRKYEGGIEHGMIHHIAKSNLQLSIALAFILYLGMPISIHPSLILVPSGFIFGLIIYVTTWSFKKYL